jgi:hypothetical protein
MNAMLGGAVAARLLCMAAIHASATVRSVKSAGIKRTGFLG